MSLGCRHNHYRKMPYIGRHHLIAKFTDINGYVVIRVELYCSDL